MRLDKNSALYKIIIGIVMVVAIVFYLYTGQSGNTETPKENESGSVADVADNDLVFRNQELLDQHYEKHGIEMGFSSPEEYVRAANKVLENEDTLHKVEAEDSDDVYYLEETNEFVVVSKDGYIRTYFYPSDGIDYFNRQ